VLDRYFRGLGAGELSPPEAAETAPPPRPVVVSAPVQPEHGAMHEPARASAFDLSGSDPRLSVEYAVALAQPSLGVRVSAGLGRHFEGALGLRWCLTSLEESEPRGARVVARSAASRVSFAWRLLLPPGLLHLGPAVTLTLEQATTEGLPDETDRIRALWAAGAEAGFVVPVGRNLFVEASTSLDFLVPGGAGRLFVSNEEVLAPRALTLGGALGFGYAWSK